MAQPSVAQYFNTRKRIAVDEIKSDHPQKILKLDHGEVTEDTSIKPSKIAHMPISQCKTKIARTSTKKVEGCSQNIQTLLDNMKSHERCVTPPPNNAKKEANDDLKKIRQKICQSSRLKQLKESINNFKNLAQQLEAAEKKVKDTAKSPKLKDFKSLEFEVSVSPQKAVSPEKPYLSPKKECAVRRNLLEGLASPKKKLFPLDSSKDLSNDTVKQGLKLPFKYRRLSEIFRAIDTVSQILFNRKENITLHKLKPAVEQMLKRTLTEKHLAQIKFVYPDAYEFSREKLKQFGSGGRQEEWHLVVIPNIGTAENMTSEILLFRRRKLNEILIENVKNYHNEFLLSLDPPMIIKRDQITRWHPEFDLEKVPEIEESYLPPVPTEEKLNTGKEVLEKARQLFNCNTRMEQAMAKLNAVRESAPVSQDPVQEMSILKGIPKALLEKVRQKQAAKALLSMTRSVDKDKEIQLYSRLPEIARLIRNLFVSEKKSVLPLDFVLEKMGNSYRCFLNKGELEDHLKTISKELPNWLEYHNKRKSVFLKLNKNADLSIVINKLETLAKEKTDS